MPNLVESIGYSWGKVHAGLIAYLCDLHRSGTHNPLELFCRELEIPIPNRPRARREYAVGPGRGMRVDVAILDDIDNAPPPLLLEIKVDDHETGDDEASRQTKRYADASPDSA